MHSSGRRDWKRITRATDELQTSSLCRDDQGTNLDAAQPKRRHLHDSYKSLRGRGRILEDRCVDERWDIPLVY